MYAVCAKPCSMHAVILYYHGAAELTKLMGKLKMRKVNVPGSSKL